MIKEITEYISDEPVASTGIEWFLESPTNVIDADLGFRSVKGSKGVSYEALYTEIRSYQCIA